MKHWSVNIVINYDIEAETREDAIKQAEIVMVGIVLIGKKMVLAKWSMKVMIL